jgi:hypothetical protein
MLMKSTSSSSSQLGNRQVQPQAPTTAAEVVGGTVHGRALTHCLLLAAAAAVLQARFPERQYRMVVSMSLGAPGPLTIEQLFFR